MCKKKGSLCAVCERVPHHSTLHYTAECPSPECHPSFVCLFVSGLCGVAKLALLPPPRLWFWDDESKSGIKRKEKKTKQKTKQAADLKHFQLLQDQIFMQGLIAWQHNHLLHCTFVWGGQKTHTVNTHPLTNRVKQIWLCSDACEKLEYERSKKTNKPRVCFPLHVFAFELATIVLFPQQNQLWQWRGWKLLSPT